MKITDKLHSLHMKNLAKLLAVLQITREQPQYGYFLSGVRAHETSNLAEHHYLVSMIAWLLCENINEDEQLVDADAVMKMCMLHDLGELFGGDLSAPLSRKKPEMKVHARALEAMNFGFLTAFLTPKVQAKITAIYERAENKDTDEGVIVKFADMIECQFFLDHVGSKSGHRPDFYANHVKALIEKITNEKVKAKMLDFAEGFEADVWGQGARAGDFIIGIA